MATIRRRKNQKGEIKYQVIIRRQGYKPITKTFPTRDAADKWARIKEREIDTGAYIPANDASKITFREVCERYRAEVLPNKKGASQEKSRLDLIEDEFGDFALAALSPSRIAFFRDKRLKVVSAQTAKHEINLIQRVLKSAMHDLGVEFPNGLPTSKIQKPKIPASAARNRRLEEGELERLLEAARTSKSEPAARILEFAVNTGMRRGEIAKMEWKDVDLKARVLQIPETKTGNPREIPLTSRAVDILKAQAVAGGLGRGVWGGIKADSITQMFKRACAKAGIDDLRFHDLRHEAASRLAENGWSVSEISAITGHKSWQALKRYTHIRPANLLDKIDKAMS